MKKLMTVAIGTYLTLFARAGELSFSTGGVVGWAQTDGVWQSGDLSGVAVEQYNFARSWLQLHVTGPCRVTWQMRFVSNDYYASLSTYVDDVWFYGGYCSSQWGAQDCAIYGGGEHDLKWEVQGYYNELNRAGIYQVKDIVVTPAPKSVSVTFSSEVGSVPVHEKNFSTEGTYGALPVPTGADDVWTFAGWWTDPVAGERVDATSAVRFDATTLYARWETDLNTALDNDELLFETDEWNPACGVLCADAVGGSAVGSANGAKLYFAVQGPGTLSFKARGINGWGQINLYGEYMSVNSDWEEITKEYYEANERQIELQIWDALVDDLQWIPATDKILARFMIDKTTSITKRYDPGAVFGETLEDYAQDRTGYVFGGWYRDPDFVQKVNASDYVPLSGVTLYAKWQKTLAVLPGTDVPFTSTGVAPWVLAERTYTDGATVAQVALTAGDSGLAESVLAVQLSGSWFFSFDWSVLGDGTYPGLAFCIDGKTVALNSFFELTNDERQYVRIGEGEHTLQWTASTSWDTLLAAVGNVKLEKAEKASSFGTWLERLSHYGCWLTDNLESLEADSRERRDGAPSAETRYKAAIEHAIITMLRLAENETIKARVREFGFDFDLGKMTVDGTYDFEKAPADDSTYDVLFGEARPTLETVLSDLAVIPDDWTGSVSVSPSEYPIDAPVQVDVADIKCLRSFAKALLSAAYWAKAYHFAIDNEQLKADAERYVVKALPSAPSLVDETGWETCPCVDFRTENPKSPIEYMRAGIFDKKAYFLFRKSPDYPDYSVRGIFGVSVKLQQGLAERRVYFPVLYAGFGAVGWLDSIPIDYQIDYHETDEFMVTVVDISDKTSFEFGADLSIAKVLLSGFSDDYSPINEKISPWTPKVIWGYDQVLDRVRDTSALVTSKSLLKEAISLAQAADAAILARTSGKVFLFNYDYVDAANQEIARTHLETVRKSLDGAQDVDWRQGLDDKTVKAGASVANPLRVYLGALFEGRITRGLLPAFADADCTIPNLGSLPDPTVGGLLPSTTLQDICKVVDGTKLRYVLLMQSDAWRYSVSNGLARIERGEYAGDMTVPTFFGEYPVAAVAPDAFKDCSGLTSLSFVGAPPEGLATAGIPASTRLRYNSAYWWLWTEALKKAGIDNATGYVPEVPGGGDSPSGTMTSCVCLTVTNVVVQYVLNSVQPEFAVPASADTGLVNVIAEVKAGKPVAVPSSWTDDYPGFAAKFGSDFTRALTMKTGKKDGAGNDLLVWQDYVAGTDPTKEDDVFQASITIVDGKIAVSYTPELDEARKSMRKYTTWGKKSLLDAAWVEVPAGQEREYNFFKVTVEMK